MIVISPSSIEKIDNNHIILQRTKSTRSLRLSIDPLKKKAVLKAPHYLSQHHIVEFLQRHQQWIHTQLTPFFLGNEEEKLFYQGKCYQLKQHSTPKKRLEVILDIEQRILYHNLPSHLIKQRLKSWLKQQAIIPILSHCEQFSRQLNVSFSSIHLKDYKARWGSCRQDGQLTFSWRLILAPPEILEYVCAHEVAHLIEMNHSPLFWQVVKSLFPSYMSARKWLKENGKTLFYYV